MFANLLNALCTQPDHPITNVALARALNADGCPITTAYLSQLRTGARTRPTARIVGALAAHFDVPVDYFYPSTVSAEDSPDKVDPVIVGNLLDQPIHRLLVCVQGLSPTSIHLLAEFASRLRTVEDLPRRCPLTAVNSRPID